MRVLTFLHSFEPGGVERVALRLVRRWRELGIDAPLLMGRETGALRDELAEGLDYTVPRTRISSGWFETLWMIWSLPAVIDEFDPDVLFCAGNTYTVVSVMMKLMLGSRCPPIVAKLSNELVLPRLNPVSRFFSRLWAWLQLRLIDHWVVMHRSMRGQVSRGEPADLIDEVPDPALTDAQLAQLRDWRPRTVKAADGKRFVAMGRLVAQKNYPLMLNGFAEGTAPADRLTIFGDGPERASLERLSRRLGIADRVTFAGHVASSIDCLADQDAMLLTSNYEGIPAVLVEAMACGMPIIATDCGVGVRALLDDYANTTLVRSGDVSSFALGLARFSGGGVPARADADLRCYTIEAGAEAYRLAFVAACTRRGASRPLRGFARPAVPEAVAEPLASMTATK